ncbi:MAG: acyl-CoA dehydrogenase family protein [Dehalococcoidia bacterium]|jgi:alkylation response protein AidB-like acyl-CoA dehydrogenase|nr:acyl-CoA dehydrogenase family protein [Dehalococcoidia bacterium]MDW8008922.1 acyl-CoA dehydrogenase family protein [Chloroflexota bacterium]
MDFRFTEEDQRFRREVRAFLEAEWGWEAGLGDASPDSDEEFQREREFERKLAARGWLVMSWPREYGGQDASPIRQAILHEECAYFRAPIGGGPGGQAVKLVGPAIMRFGTEEQKSRFLPPIARGEVWWCQGFSEPNAGSDLASIQTRAEARGDHYVINGEKIWVSSARYADWMHLLARTDPDAPKHAGISYFLVDMRTPGISYRPIFQMTGRSGFYHVFLEDVKVPRSNLLGEENQGWRVMLTTLNLERSVIVRVGAAQRWFDDAVAYLRSVPPERWAARPERVRWRLADHLIEIEVARLLCYWVSWLQGQGAVPVREAAQCKAFSTEMAQRLANSIVQALGLAGAAEPAADGPFNRLARFFYLLTVHWTISAGTSEIQRNAIARQVLR